MANPQDELDLRALRAQVAALTARVHQLELQAGLAPPAFPAPSVQQVVPPPPPVPSIQPSAPPAPRVDRGPGFAPGAAAPPPRENLEGKIGKVWINRIGIVAILFGVAYFIKYAFDNNWINETGRIAIGVVAAIALLLWSERFRRKGYAPFSYSLKAVAIGILYLSFWAASSYFHIVPVAASFVAMSLVTVFTVVLAIQQDAEILVVFALLGGFSTPVALSTGGNHEIVLFTYVAIFDLAILVTSIFKPWRRLLWGSFIGTVIMFGGWFGDKYTYDQRNLTVLFATLFAAIFAAIPLVTPLEKSRWHKGISTTLILLPMVNAAAYFFALFAMYEQEKTKLTWYALALAAVYLALSNLFRRRVGAEPSTLKLINMLHVAVAIAFITVAVPLKLDAHWITIGWLIESAVLLFVAVRTQTNFLRYFAGTTLALGIVRLLAFDNFHTDTLVFNARFATYLVAIVILGAILFFGKRVASSREMPVIKIAGIALNLLALRGLTLEAADYFNRQTAGPYNTAYPQRFNDIRLALDFSYSAIWLIYGAGMMAFGFWKRDAFVRWQALVLMAFTIGKVFTYDVWSLEKGYRILSFIALGVVLMAISFIYQRDWLKLSPGSPENTAKGTSA